MKEHKNPKVLSEGISWMVTAVEDFGVSHLKLKVLPISSLTLIAGLCICLVLHCLLCLVYLAFVFSRFNVMIAWDCIYLQDLIDFCKDTGLQSSAAATRNSTIKLIGALHKFVGPGNGLFIIWPGGCSLVCFQF